MSTDTSDIDLELLTKLNLSNVEPYNYKFVMSVPLDVGMLG